MAAPPYLYSGPSPVASLATVLAGFEVNERRGDALRADAARASRRACSTTCDRLGVHTPNRSGFPIVEIPLRDHDDRRGRRLPVRPRHLRHARRLPARAADEVGFRVQLTAANTDAEVDALIAALEARRAPASCASAEVAASPHARRRTEMASGPPCAARTVAGLPGRRRVIARLRLRAPRSPRAARLMNLLGLSPLVAIIVGVRRIRRASLAP